LLYTQGLSYPQGFSKYTSSLFLRFLYENIDSTYYIHKDYHIHKEYTKYIFV